MQWKQFFISIDSVDTNEGHNIVKNMPKEELTILDVRQPNEYKRSHIPGSKLIPLPQLAKRCDEIPPENTILVY